ncbi:MAG: acyl-CoA dehydrogenase family protein [Alphaproteobacteria bacterium]
MVTAINEQEVINQSPPLVGLNLFDDDPALVALLDNLPREVTVALSEHGRAWGAADSQELGRLANRTPPVLETHDANGRRIDAVDFHPAYHALMRRSVAAGLHASLWDASGEEAAVRAIARAARLFMSAAVDRGHLAGISSTNASVAALGRDAQLAGIWLPTILSRQYDQSDRRPEEKRGALVGFAAVEKHAGVDQSGYATEARETGDGSWMLSGHKWFVTTPNADGMVVLAQTIEGLSAFMMPRRRDDGRRNAIRLVRLKDSLGQRSSAIAEVELDEATGWLIGQRGKGAEAVADTMALMRFDEAIVAAGAMRAAMGEAVHHARHRRVFGMPLIDQPLMTRVLADMALDAAGAAALAFRLAEAYDRAADDPKEAAFSRLMTPVARYWITKVNQMVASEAMECLGGNGFVEGGAMARFFRDSAVGSIRNGTGNAMCVEVMRQLRRSSEVLEVVLDGVELALGSGAQSSLNVLRAATAVALADEGSSRILVEQLALTAAAAALRQRLPSVVSDAFVETRLSKPWRSTYGMLDSRFDSKAFLNYLYPAR